MSYQMIKKKPATPKPSPILGSVTWPNGPSIRQRFSLPKPIIRYMAMNPSNPDLYLKMAQICKYFFESNPVLIVRNMEESIMCSNIECKKDECCVRYDFNVNTSKIWITNEFDLVGGCEPNFTSLLASRLYKCDATELMLEYTAIAKFDDYKALAQSAKRIIFANVKMTHDDGKEPVMLESILEAAPLIEDFYFECCPVSSMVSTATLKNILALPNLEKLNRLQMFDISAVDGIEECFEVMKDTKISLVFNRHISQEYKKYLDSVIDTIIKSNTPRHFIIYRGQDREKLKLLRIRAGAPVEDEYEEDGFDFDDEFEDDDDAEESEEEMDDSAWGVVGPDISDVGIPDGWL